jgi:hypothetical protein
MKFINIFQRRSLTHKSAEGLDRGGREAERAAIQFGLRNDSLASLMSILSGNQAALL